MTTSASNATTISAEDRAIGLALSLTILIAGPPPQMEGKTSEERDQLSHEFVTRMVDSFRENLDLFDLELVRKVKGGVN